MSADNESRQPAGQARGTPGTAAAARSHKRTAGVLFGVAVGMLGMAYAAVPLYRIFCQTTGYGGTPLVAVKNSEVVLDTTIEVRFDANVAPGLPWKFTSKEPSRTVRLGETVLVEFHATNVSDRPTRGTASFNVAPDSAGAYFNKIECFCFTEQTLKPGESADMPVVFFVDPGILEDPETQSVGEITLSYTFYPVNKPQAVSAASNAAGVTN